MMAAEGTTVDFTVTEMSGCELQLELLFLKRVLCLVMHGKVELL